MHLVTILKLQCMFICARSRRRNTRCLVVQGHYRRDYLRGGRRISTRILLSGGKMGSHLNI